MTSTHPWTFFRAGGFDQVALESADDLRALGELDQKLWVALACPVKGNKLSETTLELVDTDKDGRIRAPDIIAAVNWIDRVLKDLGVLVRREDGLALSNIDETTDEGKAVLASARRILAGRGTPDAKVITVADTTGAATVLRGMTFNGDGILPPTSVEDVELRAVLEEILKTVGGEYDCNGEQGVSADKVGAFWTALTDYEGWWRKAEVDEDTVVPLGERTAVAVEAYAAVKAKINDYFTRCELTAFDPRSAAHLIGAEGQWASIAARTLAAVDEEIAHFPLATVAADRPLPLKSGINPAWAARMAVFVREAVEPLIGEQEALTAAQWKDLGSRFDAYEAWFAGKAGQAVEPLGIDRVRALLASEHRAALDDLIAQDAARKPEADALEAVDRATRYHRDLHVLLANFINFRDFYDRSAKSIFQAGVLYLDGRSCELVLQVEDVGKHSAIAPQSFAYLAYCECNRKATGEKMNLVAAFTGGDSDFLLVGRNGLFYDRDGRDWDATIVKVVEQPISIRQAFWAPYKRLVTFVSNQAEKFAADRDKAAEANATSSVTAQTTQLAASTKGPPPLALGAPAAPPAPAPAKPAPSAFDIGKYAGIFAAVGLALGFIVSAVTMLLTAFLDLRLWQMPLVIAGILLLISGPSMLLAAFKLNHRNLAPLLDANGWAINARARLNIPFGASLTQVAALPTNARRSLERDPFKDKRSRVGWYVFLGVLIFAAAILWDLGFIPKWIGLEPEPAPAEAPAPEAAPAAPAAEAAPAAPAAPAAAPAAPAAAPAAPPAP